MRFLCKSVVFLAALAFTGSAVRGDVVIDLRVDFVEAGPVVVGSTVNWNLFVQVSASEATNFGAASLDVDLTESLGNTLSAGTIAAPFTDYTFSNGGIGGAGTLTAITAVMNPNNSLLSELIDPVNGGSLAEILYASGSYTVTTLGTHTLTPSQGATMRYFPGGTSILADSLPYTSANFTGDSVTAISVPEPSSSFALAAVAMGGLLARRRKRTKIEPKR